MINSKRVFVCLIVSVSILAASCELKVKPTNKEPAQEEAKKAPKNIILMIGDGMGLSQLSTAFYYQDKPSNFQRFPQVGLIKTSSGSHKITDSAAGATAFSAGKKSYNGAIGVDMDTLKVQTILEKAAEQGQRTGVISTSSITHATPASFYAHVASRNMEEEIAADFLKSPVYFAAGGGLEFFHNRKDGSSLIPLLQKQGYHVDTAGLFNEREMPQGKQLYLLAADGMPKMQEGRGDFLPMATRLAIENLNEAGTGFFLMVEGSQIDWGGHANDAEYIIEEVKDFDEAVGAALDFAEQDGQTLVIVTADHETGGFTLAAEEFEYKNGMKKGDYSKISPTFSTGGHSSTLIPVLSYGPGSEAFGGIYENTEIHSKMLAAMGWE